MLDLLLLELAGVLWARNMDRPRQIGMTVIADYNLSFSEIKPVRSVCFT